MATARDFRGQRRAIALAFSSAPRTLNEAARALGWTPGSIYGLVQRMAAEDLLIPDSLPITRGTQYRLADGARAILERLAEEGQPLGQLAERQRLLLVSGTVATAEVQDLLAQSPLCGCVAWVAEINGADGLLLAMTPGTRRNEVQRLALALHAAGLTCVHQEVGELFNGTQLRTEATASLDVVRTGR